MAIKADKRNYRKHNDKNKALIKKSLEECGAGRSIVIDNEDEIIAGNGIYEQAKKLGIKTKIIETDGTELVVVKRTDLATNDEKRKQLAIMDNSTSDSSEFDITMLKNDFDLNQLNDFGLDVEFEELDPEPVYNPKEEQELEKIIENLPQELKETKLMPDEFQEIVSSFKPLRERIIITFPDTRKDEIARLIGQTEVSKVVYSIEELLGESHVD